MRVEIAARCGNEVGESVLWDSEREEVLWVDIERGSILRLEPRSGAVHRSQPDDRIGAIGLREGGGLVLGLASGFALLDSIDGSLERLQTVESDLPTTRLNDGRVDRSGRFICGGMDEAANKQPISAVYRLDPDQQASLDQALVPRRWSPTDSSGTSAAVLRAPTFGDALRHLDDALSKLGTDGDQATASADAAIAAQRELETAYYAGMVGLLGVEDRTERITRRERYRHSSRIGEAVVDVAERIVYAVVKQS